MAVDSKEKRPLQQYFDSNIPNAMCIPNITILKDENYISDTLLSIGLFEPIVNIA